MSGGGGTGTGARAGIGVAVDRTIAIAVVTIVVIAIAGTTNVTMIAIVAEDVGGVGAAWTIVAAQVPPDPAVAVPAWDGAGGGGIGTGA